MSSESLRLAGILLVVYPTVVFGGASILWHWITARTDYYDHALRQRMWAAGHAHAGVLLLLSLVMLVLVDQTDLTGAWAQVARTGAPLAAILVPAAFFLSIASPTAERPNRLVNLAYLGAVSLVVGMATLGVGLLQVA
jgi:hypothetical protein